MFSRRELGKMAWAALAVPGLMRAQPDGTDTAGVRLGVQTYSFRELKPAAGGDALDLIIAAMRECGFRECELYAPQVARGAGPGAVRKKFDAAGISIYGYNYSFRRTMTDEDIDRGFDMARALGADIITASTTLDVAKRVVPFAEKHKMVVAMHNHSDLTDPREFATPASFAAAMQMSPYFKVNLDIGHFTAANFDAVAYIREHHEDITNLHLKDRRKNQGENTPWGEGDTPIREVLQLLKRERWPIRAYVEYEYKGKGTPVEEARACLQYARRALA